MFKRLKDTGNAQKDLIRDNNESIYYTPRSEFDDKYKKKQQNDDIDTKPPNVFDYLKSLTQEAKDLIDEREDANDDIHNGKLLFIGNNKEKFNINNFRMPLNFLSAIYNGEISLKEAEFKQRNLEKKIEDLRGYKNNAEEKEKEEINEVLMQANDMLEYKDKIIDAFKNGIFLSGHLKTSDDAAHGHVLEDVKDFIQKIELMSEKINLSLFEDFSGSPSPAIYAKILINTEDPDKTKNL